MDRLDYFFLGLTLLAFSGDFPRNYAQKYRPHERDDQSHAKHVRPSRDDDQRHNFAPGRSFNRPEYAVANQQPGRNLYRRRGALSASKQAQDDAVNQLKSSGSRRMANREEIIATTAQPPSRPTNIVSGDLRPDQHLPGNALFFPSGQGFLSILVQRKKPVLGASLAFQRNQRLGSDEVAANVFSRPLWTVPRNNTGVVNLTKSSPQTATSLLALFGW
ncbi:uncharacterized protein LOC129592792 [Paramacrobiotus metropolitanus]|uniref:uncharacterized protein LOC129592792 n=1 Tax=Paramacrobiotus metropolitanus TaxID=2943436 RepID=UPI00244581F6|nr:uncharacterized protein LOC129592792 [Paramacrobiotus metropolitanus]